ncbi:hypothetical protein [Aquibacillus kalidii]|uniref:hypothetical protein n=1 Tax=Aquibacillus kalidii TaxID=2762597 RepID=UPI001645084B|nr:hypothetical protein [Aquibacillus kalidii]
MKYWEDEGFHISIYDGIIIEELAGSSTFSVGKTQVKQLYTNEKNNNLAYISGNNNCINFNPKKSPILDKDLKDSILYK